MELLPRPHRRGEVPMVAVLNSGTVGDVGRTGAGLKGFGAREWRRSQWPQGAAPGRSNDDSDGAPRRRRPVAPQGERPGEGVAEAHEGLVAVALLVVTLDTLPSAEQLRDATCTAVRSSLLLACVQPTYPIIDIKWILKTIKSGRLGAVEIKQLGWLIVAQVLCSSNGLCSCTTCSSVPFNPLKQLSLCHAVLLGQHEHFCQGGTVLLSTGRCTGQGPILATLCTPLPLRLTMVLWFRGISFLSHSCFGTGPCCSHPVQQSSDYYVHKDV
ncbi:hypothetical protein E2562_034741 [Oryza meyeriana var. granulata]|uniref:Uncharacterized protein n=1 Tax=Oryza meyeriana var. granulata TaxID=110450 RepID=A0A6G1CWI5_9ORYZ|nr:hypothetical protein E2562_034741 [Oryza meyeriana var. granulata]